MVAWPSLIGSAAAFLFAALLVARLRRLTARDAGADALAVLTATLAMSGLTVALYGLASREAGSWALLAAPVVSTVALRLRGRRSMPRALIVSAIALAVLVGWLTLRLKGVRGGWTAAEIGLVTLTASVAITSAACLGWWSKAARRTR